MTLLSIVSGSLVSCLHQSHGSEQSHQIMQMIPSFALLAGSLILDKAPAHEFSQVFVPFVLADLLFCLAVKVSREDRGNQKSLLSLDIQSLEAEVEAGIDTQLDAFHAYPFQPGALVLQLFCVICRR